MRLFATTSRLSLALRSALAAGLLASATSIQAAPPIELKGELMFRLLEAEFSLQAGDLGTAASRYLWSARRTQDGAIAQRAFELCWAAGSTTAALEAAQIWHAAEPDSLEAREKFGSALLTGKRSAEGVTMLRGVLSADPKRAANLFTQLPIWLDGNSDNASPRLPVVEAVTQGYTQLPEAQYVLAIAAFQDNKPDMGLPRVEKVLKSRPRWPQAALLKGWLLQQKSPSDAIRWLEDWQKRYGATALTNEYLARLNLKQQHVTAARRDFERQTELAPEDPRAAFAAGYIAYEMRDWPAAARYLQMAVDRGYEDSTSILYYLGEAQAQQGQRAQALQSFDAVKGGNEYEDAIRRAAQLRLEAGQGDEALARIRTLRAANPRASLWLFEVDILRSLGRDAAALQAAEDGIKDYPDDEDLRYARSMMLDRAGRYAEAEKDLRWLLGKKPDDATILNALGYLLTDRTQRFAEALPLLEKAHTQKPEDPFILDSLGWVYFKLGRVQESVTHLQQAWAGRPDAEIAAHLVEALWTLGRKDEARTLYATALKQHPDHEALQNVRRLFNEAK